MQLAVNWRYGTIGPIWFRRLLWAWRWYWSGEHFPLSQHETEYLCRKLDEAERKYPGSTIDAEVPSKRIDAALAAKKEGL